MGVKMADYANPNALVDTEWVAQNLDAPGVRLVEVDVDTAAYDQGHAPGAVGWNWKSQLQESVVRDVVEKSEFEKLLASPASATTRASSCTATTTTGSPRGPTGS